MEKPRVLVLNDDQALIESRKRLLEDCGAIVMTARGNEESLLQIIREVVDLVIIDATNIGLERGERLCNMVKLLRPSERVAILVQPELGIPSETVADRIIYRSGPRRILSELNEMLDGRLDLDLWEGTVRHDNEDRSAGNPG